MAKNVAVACSIHSFREMEDRGMPLTFRRRSPLTTPVASFKHDEQWGSTKLSGQTFFGNAYVCKQTTYPGFNLRGNRYPQLDDPSISPQAVPLASKLYVSQLRNI